LPANVIELLLDQTHSDKEPGGEANNLTSGEREPDGLLLGLCFLGLDASPFAGCIDISADKV
jgi:hypothetical protein